MNIVQEYIHNTNKDWSDMRAFISWFEDWVDSFYDDETIPAYLRETVAELSEDVFDMWETYEVGSDISEYLVQIEEFLRRSYGKQLQNVEDVSDARNLIMPRDLN